MWLLWALFIGAVVAGLVMYGDYIQRRDRADQAAVVAAAVNSSQPSVDELVALVRAELEEEMAARMTGAISDVQDSILEAVSTVLAEARGEAVGGPSSGSADVSDAVTAPIRDGRRAHRLQWDDARGVWVDPNTGRALSRAAA